jgi:hypothetical protein
MKKYLVIPDYIISKNDGQRHYISCNKLVQLYGVDEGECVFVESSSTGKMTDSIEYNKKRYGNLIELKPKHSGNYILGDIHG